jgi:hypothetical protein
LNAQDNLGAPAVRLIIDVPLEYGITLSQNNIHTFPSVLEDYEAPTPHLVTITNIGVEETGTLNISLSGMNPDDFIVSKTEVNSIVASGTDNFTIVPKTGLALGLYTATVIVSGNNDISESFDVSFKVTDLTGLLRDSISALQAENKELRDSIAKLNVEWFNFTEDLLDTIEWLRNLLAECKTSNAPLAQENQIQIYPNPVNHELRVTNYEWKSGDVIELYDMLGRKIYSRPAPRTLYPETFTIDMSLYQSGTYILRIGNRVAKVIKQ